MSTRKLKSFHRFVISQCNHYIVMLLVDFFLILTTVGYQPEPAFWWLWPIFGIAVSIFFVGVDRKRFAKLYYLGFFLFIGVCIFIARNLNTQFAFAAIGGVYILTALFPDNSKSFLRKEVMPIVIPFAFGLLCTWSLHKNGLIVEQRNFIYVFLVVLYLYALSFFVDKYFKYLEFTKHSIGYIPTQDILFSGLKYIAIATSSVALFFLLVANMDFLNEVLTKIKVFFYKLFMKLMSNQKESSLVESFVEPNKEHMEDYIPKMREVSPFWDKLIIFLFWLLVVYAVFRLTRFLIKLLRNFRIGKFSLWEKTEEEKQEEDQEELDVIEKIIRKRENLFFRFTPREKIRKMYKKKVVHEFDRIEESCKGDDLRLYTARECADALGLERMGDLYEKARYSPYEITQEDVNEMNAVCKE